ncbi:GTPase-associated system all-helical protein GASH [Aureispira anguillae]|uniref:GTPase-associated system helical domain-containing protein n=1 Tax=Aureispira anguillae TaxID=2864201 RepID=A0A916DUN6_9BACT|nr:GTPase-associated system all-helical protein GASH [Aureispira anguillae]BDS12401.1 hypothetical protein AsAng_0031220 [Aureispira anguillae]
MLEEFMNSGLLSIKEDTHFEKLKKSAVDLAKRIKKSNTKIISYVSTALDPNVPPDNLNVEETKKVIVKHWNTFIAHTHDTPITYIRVVMLEALKNLGKEIDIASLIWLSGRNIQQYFELKEKERKLTNNFLLGLGKRTEEEAVKKWSLPADDEIYRLVVEIKNLSKIQINEEELLSGLKAASIHTGHSEDGENPQIPAANNAVWATFFSEKSSETIADLINEAFTKQHNELLANQTEFQEAVNKLLSKLNTDISRHRKTLRTQLLWWKEACYSTSINNSYRGQNDGVLQLLLAKDYSDFIPTIFPTSVDFFLRETHNSLNRPSSKIKILDFMKELKESAINLKSLFPESGLEVSRGSLLDFVKGILWDKYKPNQIEEIVGISGEVEIELSELTKWIFHDIQALKL